MRIETQRFHPRDVRLWIGVLLPPAAALGAQWLCYSLVHQSCVHGTKLGLFAIKAAAAAACAAAFVLARGAAPALPAEGDPAGARARFQSHVGQVFAAFFFLLIVAMAIPDLLLRVCD